jgi:hypothetical protein
MVSTAGTCDGRDGGRRYLREIVSSQSISLVDLQLCLLLLLELPAQQHRNTERTVRNRNHLVPALKTRPGGGIQRHPANPLPSTHELNIMRELH